MKKAANFYIGVVLLSSIVTSMQILQSRIFSVTTWYHLSFLVISIAMFGLTLGALAIYRGDEQDQRNKIGQIAARCSFSVGCYLALALYFQLRIPLVFDQFRWTFITLPLLGIITGIPYYYAGMALTLCLTRTRYPIGQIYGFDLVGAAGGCIIALILMQSVDTPSAILIVSSLCVVASYFLFKSNENAPIKFERIKTFVGLLFLLISLINICLSKPFLYPLNIKGKIMFESYFDYDHWNAISRVTITKEISNVIPFLWGPSSRLPVNIRVDEKYLTIDGDAGTILTKFDGSSWKNVSYLEYDVTNIAYSLPDLKNAAIIGVGGGRDLLSAKYFGIPEVTALDINNIQTSLLIDNDKFRLYTNLYDQPGVTIINSEARSWFRRNKHPFDIIEMSLIDTWAATGAGAFSLSENGLYTVDAWKTFFDNLSPNGVFTVSRWYKPGVVDEAGRQVSLAVAMLLKSGVANPQKHIFMVASGKIATMLVFKAPLDEARLRILEDQALSKDFSIIVTPRDTNLSPILTPFLEAHNITDLDRAANALPLDLSPTSDMHPFFFNQVRFFHPLQIMRLAFSGDDTGTFAGHAKATFNLLIIIGFSFIMTISVIIFPIIKNFKYSSKVFVFSGSGYFSLIGIGFMLLEISLLQGFGVFLGHPVYGLGIVLFSVILSTGVGSFLSEYIPLETNRNYFVWCVLTVATTVLLSVYISPVFSTFGTASLIGRALVCLLIISPLGVLLGYGFPTGMKLVSSIDSRATAWFWGINGAAGVFSSGLAIAFNIALGIDQTILVGGLCYGLLFPLMVTLKGLAPSPVFDDGHLSD